jgi:hypothetical protein
MGTPAQRELLAAWERGLRQRAPERALTLLALSRPEADPSATEGMPPGRRDAELLGLRGQLFGDTLSALADCPGCGERLELDLSLVELTAPAGAGDAGSPVVADGHTVRFRLPNAGDLCDAGACPTAEEARSLLLARCVCEAWAGGTAVPAGSLPEPVVQAVTEAMRDADPQAAVELAMRCPACELDWRAGFDIAAFLWAELDAWASQTFADVHALASAYGWSEGEILALGPSRRRQYLDLVGV